MPLTPGTRLGPYEVTGPLGEGGMGEVYRARDARPGRDAALNHPHIGAIYGLEEVATSGSTGTAQYLILELMEGGTLAERLGRGPLPVHEALAIGRQIADALDAAHTQGLIHRDLKRGFS